MKSPLYVIVKFELQGEELETLLSLIKKFFLEEVGSFPGFISFKLHANEKGTVLINYATWQSMDHFQKFIAFASTSELSRQIQLYQPKADWVYEMSV